MALPWSKKQQEGEMPTYCKCCGYKVCIKGQKEQIAQNINKENDMKEKANNISTIFKKGW